MKQSFPIWTLIVSTALVLILVGAFMIFMGGRSLSVVTGTATAQVSDSQKPASGLNSIQPGFSMSINCGQASVARGVLPGAAALDAAICFQFAFESCNPAQIALRDVDTGTTRTFATGKQGTRCYIVLTTQFADASKGPAPAPIYCSGEAMQTDGLHISGCDGGDDIVIPAIQRDQMA